MHIPEFDKKDTIQADLRRLGCIPGPRTDNGEYWFAGNGERFFVPDPDFDSAQNLYRRKTADRVRDFALRALKVRS